MTSENVTEPENLIAGSPPSEFAQDCKSRGANLVKASISVNWLKKQNFQQDEKLNKEP